MKNYLLFTVLLLLTLSCAVQKRTDMAIPEKTGNVYIIRLPGQALEIDVLRGGRIAALTFNGKNILANQQVNAVNWGSTFWPSPQSTWKWPPPAELDNKPYAVAIENNIVKMTSLKDPKTRYIFSKEISGNKKTGAYQIKYTITNGSGETRQVAPWEITRVYPAGITFYPDGQQEIKGNLAAYTENKNGITWFHHEPAKMPARALKLFADGGEGWLGQVNDNILFIKKFADIPYGKTAPEEGEIEIYASPDKKYVEIEQQGAYEILLPGASTSWEVTWYVRKLPDNIKAEAGNPALVKFTRQILK